MAQPKQNTEPTPEADATTPALESSKYTANLDAWRNSQELVASIFPNASTDAQLVAAAILQVGHEIAIEINQARRKGTAGGGGR